MSSFPETAYMPTGATHNPTNYSSKASSPRRDSAVSSKSTMPPPHGSRSSSRSSRRQASYDRAIRIPGPRRINSAPYGQLPQMNIEAAIALHQRSCALFRTTSTVSNPSSHPPVTSGRSSYHEEVQPRQEIQSSPETLAEDLSIIDEKFTLDAEADVPPATEIRWTSDETRRREYAEIDRAHSGIKGLFRRMFPRIAAKSNRSRFYSEDDGSEAGSIRRYRLDVPERA